MSNAPSNTYLLWCRLWFYDCFRYSTETKAFFAFFSKTNGNVIFSWNLWVRDFSVWPFRSRGILVWGNFCAWTTDYICLFKWLYRQAKCHASWCYTVAIGKPERQVRKASHCGSKQQYFTRRDHSIIVCLHHIYMGISVREGIILGGRKKFALKILICHENKQFALKIPF